MKHTFRAVIQEGRGGGAFVRIPFDVEQVFGRKRLPVRAWIDGEPYRGTLVRMGEPCHILGILKEIRTRIGKDIGSEVEIVLDEDLEERTVEVPPDLLQALAGFPEAQAAFERLSYTHRRETVRPILDAKRLQTRQNRIQQVIEMLINKKEA